MLNYRSLNMTTRDLLNFSFANPFLSSIRCYVLPDHLPLGVAGVVDEDGLQLGEKL